MKENEIGLENSQAQLSVTRFSQKDIDLGRLQYVHAAHGAGRDAFDFNISSPHITKGPYSLYFDVYEHHVSSLSKDGRKLFRFRCLRILLM